LTPLIHLKSCYFCKIAQLIFKLSFWTQKSFNHFDHLKQQKQSSCFINSLPLLISTKLFSVSNSKPLNFLFRFSPFHQKCA